MIFDKLNNLIDFEAFDYNDKIDRDDFRFFCHFENLFCYFACETAEQNKTILIRIQAVEIVSKSIEIEIYSQNRFKNLFFVKFII